MNANQPELKIAGDSEKEEFTLHVDMVDLTKGIRVRTFVKLLDGFHGVLSETDKAMHGVQTTEWFITAMNMKEGINITVHGHPRQGRKPK